MTYQGGVQVAVDASTHVQNMVGAALAATAGESDTVKSAAVGAAASTATGTIPAPSSRTTNALWIILVVVLGSVVLASAISIVVYAGENKTSPPDVLITVLTTALSGLIGLFVRPPSNP
jgi:hypothetical protein